MSFLACPRFFLQHIYPVQRRIRRSVPEEALRDSSRPRCDGLPLPARPGYIASERWGLVDRSIQDRPRKDGAGSCEQGRSARQEAPLAACGKIRTAGAPGRADAGRFAVHQPNSLCVSAMSSWAVSRPPLFASLLSYFYFRLQPELLISSNRTTVLLPQLVGTHSDFVPGPPRSNALSQALP